MISRHTLLVFLKGLAMGAADSVPGVSGGTIAFITHIYDELLDSIRAVNLTAARLLLTRGPARAWLAINGPFLLPLACGIVLALAASANLVVWLLANRYAYLMCFFNGLIMASTVIMAREVPGWTIPRVALFLLGASLAVALAVMPQAPGMDSLAYYFLCGAIAICAMILPGISGAFILLLLGAYQPVLAALVSLDLPVVLAFVAGCATGLLSFSRLLSWLLHRHRAGTLAVLLGVLAGSLYSLWPWRMPVPDDPSCAVDCEGAVSFVNLTPMAMDAVSGGPLSLPLCGLLVAAGAGLVLGLEAVSSKFRKKSNSSA